MHLKNLQLHQFKNHTESQFTFTEKVICFVGNNGAGKTNLLEAISYLAPGRGLRGARLNDVGRTHSGSDSYDNDGHSGARRGWAVAAEINHYGKVIEIGTGLETGSEESARGRRVIMINGNKDKTQSELGKYTSALWLTPQMVI